MGRKRKGASRRPTRSRHTGRLTGTVRITDAGAYVETAEGMFRLTQRGVREAMNGDTVTVSLHRGPGGQMRAVVESTEVRVTDVLVGTYDIAGPLGVIRPLDTRIRQDFFVLPRDRSAADHGVEPGDVVSARIVSYPTRYESGVVTIERRIGGADAPDLGIQCVMARYDLADGYPQAAVDEARARTLDVDAALADPLRRDIRDRFLLTIDPIDARDFDDAISVERTAQGGWKLGVHIADVSAYVPWESHVDLEARRRATSVYLADRVLPMLPEELSCDLCSLVPGEERLAFTVDIELDRRGRLRGFTPYPSVIRSRVRMDYEAADALLDGADGTTDVLSPDRAAALERARGMCADAARCGVDLAAFLRDADELAGRRREIRHARGAIDFETVEIHALLDEDGMPCRIVKRERTRATSLVEEAMLLANECVASWLSDRGLEAAYRVHEAPSADELSNAAKTLAGIGAIDRETAAGIRAGDPAAIERAVASSRETGFAPLVNAVLLRAMQRAVYRPHNLGHYALGAPAYCHFTSPIRRYPDLLVHRVLKWQLARDRLGAAASRDRASELVGNGDQALVRVLPQLCRQSSAAERTADAAAHASQKVKVAQYYASRIGERLSGCVSWIDAMGAFVRLDDTGAEGLIRLSALGGDEWWDLDEERFQLTGTSSGRALTLGTRVIVEVVGANPIRGHVDFELIHVRRALH